MLLPAVGRSSKFADVASSWIINLNQQLFQKSTLLSLRNHLFSTSSSQQSNAKVKDYLRRINYQGSLNPDLKTLATLSRIHKTTVPYTNVEFVNGTRKILDIDILHQRIVKDRGGGVCHELNGLFTWLLRELGYEVLLFNVKVYLDATKDWMEWASHSFPFVSSVFRNTFPVLITTNSCIVGLVPIYHGPRLIRASPINSTGKHLGSDL